MKLLLLLYHHRPSDKEKGHSAYFELMSNCQPMKEIRRCHMSDSHSLMSQRVQFIIRVTTEQIRTDILDPQGSWYKYQQPWYNHVKLMNHINTRFAQHYSIRV
jgi:hypothetical protein